MRDRLVNYLEKNNIFTTVHYIPANFHKFYKKSLKTIKFQIPIIFLKCNFFTIS